jgi:hypothetical protein
MCEDDFFLLPTKAEIVKTTQELTQKIQKKNRKK